MQDSEAIRSLKGGSQNEKVARNFGKKQKSARNNKKYRKTAQKPLQKCTPMIAKHKTQQIWFVFIRFIDDSSTLIMLNKHLTIQIHIFFN